MKVKLLVPFFALFFSVLAFSQTINDPVDMILCDDNNDGIEAFNLSSQTPDILGELSPNNYTVTYHVTQADADQQLNPVPSPYTNVTNPQTIYVAVFENSTGNLELRSFELIVNSLPINTFAQDVIVCDEGNGFGTFDLTIFDDQFVQGNANLAVSYFEVFQDALSGTNPISNPSFYTNTTPFFQNIFVRIDDVTTGCFYVGDNAILYLNVSESIDINTPTPLVGCDDDNDGFYQFDLDSKTAEILGGNQNPTLIVTYHETLVDAENDINALISPYNNIVIFSQTVFVRVSSIISDCATTTTLDLIVDINCVSASSLAVVVCAEDPNIPVDYDLTSQETNMVNGQNTSDFTFSYYFSQEDADNQINPITNPEVYEVSGNSSIVYVLIEDNQTGNSIIVQIFVNFSLNPQVSFNDTYTICNGQEVLLFPTISGNGNNNNYSYLWNTGETSPEIFAADPGTYTVTVTDLNSGCSGTGTVDVSEGDLPAITNPADLTSCDPNATYDLTSVIPEVLQGQNAEDFIISFFNIYDDVLLNINSITNASAYVPAEDLNAVFVRVQNIGDACFNIVEFEIITLPGCPIIVDCLENPVNTSYCYDINDATAYVYESADDSLLQVVFNAGQVEVDWDELVVLDSDGITNLNPEATTYGNNGDLTGLSFISSGNSITVYVDSDEIFSCTTENYIPLDYTVSCFDDTAIPVCSSILLIPTDGAIDVNENTNVAWTASSGLVNGYKLSLGITSGGTEVLDGLDVGNVLTYDLETLDYEVTYYITITAYNDNGDAEDCTEESFTTRANPNQIVICEDGAVNTTYCYTNNDNSEFAFESSDGLPLTLVFNTGETEVNFDTIEIIDSDGSILNPTLPYGNDGDFSGLSYTSSGSRISVLFDSDGSISCVNGNTTADFDFDVFCASSVGFIQVNAFVDANTNSVFDANEFSFYNGYFTYEMNNDGIINTVNSSTGSFQIISANETDTYDITLNTYEESAGCYEVTIPVFNDISVATGNTVTVQFPVVEEQSCEDLAVYLINTWTPPRPGFTHENYLILENLGFTTIASGTVEFVADPLLVFNGITNVNPNYAITTTANGFTVDFVNLQPGDFEAIEISLSCPTSVELGDIVTNSATYVTSSNDLVEVNNYSTLSELVVASWDPNDKMEAHGPRILYDNFVISDEWLYYTIRFQNLGTFQATFVKIDDTLDNQLDETTFQMLRSSHDNVVTRIDNNLEWFFNDINLPAEQDDAEGSQGYVYFRIKPKAGYAIGDIIPNTAAIYFDFNAPVITNRFDTEFVEETLSVSETNFTTFNMFPNPAKHLVNINLNSNTFGNTTINIIDLQGKQVLETKISNENSIDIDVSGLQSGMYFVKVNSDTKNVVKKLIIE